MKAWFNTKKVEDSVRNILEEIGVEKNTETYKNTPGRVARAYLELFAGMDRINEPKLTLFDNPGYKDILALRSIPIYSMCAHHLLPMFGDASVAYIPDKKIMGLSKFARIVKYFASKPQVQEELTKNIADYFDEKLKPLGVLVMIKARHLCMETRGVKTRGVETISSAVRGVFLANPSTKEEALSLLLHS